MPLSKKQLANIFQKHEPLIKRAVNKFKPEVSGITAEDVQQEVSIRLYKFLQSDRAVENISSYIYKITSNTIIDLARKNQKYYYDVGIDESGEDEKAKNYVQSPGLMPDMQLQNQSLVKKVLEIIERLPENRRVTVKLRLQGFSVKEICEITGWPFYKVENLSKRSMSALKKELLKVGINYDEHTDEP